ncbi:putative phospholipid-transporting ATPase 9 [Bienertia sinuspersici]
MAPRDEDVGWDVGEPIDVKKRRIKCKFCNKIFREGITRLKQHLAHEKGDVTPASMDKQQIDSEYEEELIKSMNHPIDDDGDYDAEMK